MHAWARCPILVGNTFSKVIANCACAEAAWHGQAGWHQCACSHGHVECARLSRERSALLEGRENSRPTNPNQSPQTMYHNQGCAQEVISGGKFPRGIKRRGQPCACVQRTYLAGGQGCGKYARIITGIIKLLLWSRSTGHYLGMIGRILRINNGCARCKL